MRKDYTSLISYGGNSASFIIKQSAKLAELNALVHKNGGPTANTAIQFIKTSPAAEDGIFSGR